MRRNVVIRGDGVAARCCLRLLDPSRFLIRWEHAGRPKLPALMLGDTAQKILRDVFGGQDLFSGLPRIRKRVVAWGRTAPVASVPHSAVVISEPDLLDRLQCASPRDAEDDGPAPDWTVLTARPLPAGSVERQFGSRMAVAFGVTLAPAAEEETCWVESVSGGWRFLVPGGSKKGWLLSVGDGDDPLRDSELVAAQIGEMGSEVGRFPCHPRIAEPVAQTGWLACGSGAVGFDPLCGDGSGYAAREAILASAVLRAIADGASAEAAIGHYRTRLIAGFQRHLQVCREFYRNGGESPWWRAEAKSLEPGIEWCQSQLDAGGRFQFRLDGFRLEPLV